MGRRRKTSVPVGTVVLDCDGLSRLVAAEHRIVAFVQESRKLGMRVVVSALTIIEATHAGTDRKRLAWLLSGMHIEPVDETAACLASKLLQANGLHGHTHAIDAVVAEAAVRQSAPVVLLTSDTNDMTTLCGDEVHLIRT